MKIVHAIAYYGSYLGGIQIYLSDIAMRQTYDGNSVKIITSSKSKGGSTEGKVSVERLWTPLVAFRVPFTPTLLFALLKEDCDVLHAYLPLPWLDLCVWLKKIIHPHTKLVVSVNNYVPTSSMLSKIFSWVHNHITIHLALNAADVIVAPSLEFAESLPYSLPKDKLKIISYGIDTEKFHLASTYDHNQVLFVGRLIPEKGLHILVEAMKKVVKVKPQTKLLAICSETYDYKEYKEEILLQGHDFLKIKTNVPNSEMTSHYSKSAIFVMPSLDIDSLGIVLLEAMASGCPVVCSDLPGPKSVVEPSGGYVVPKGNVEALSEAILVSLNQQSNETRRAVREYVKNKYEWDLEYDRLMEVYSSQTSDMVTRGKT
jgi:glycosyltransferase involved in cell wall biosynthesis